MVRRPGAKPWAPSLRGEAAPRSLGPGSGAGNGSSFFRPSPAAAKLQMSGRHLINRKLVLRFLEVEKPQGAVYDTLVWSFHFLNERLHI